MWKFLMDLYFVEGKSEIIIAVLIFADHQLNYIVSAFFRDKNFALNQGLAILTFWHTIIVKQAYHDYHDY